MGKLCVCVCVTAHDRALLLEVSLLSRRAPPGPASTTTPRWAPLCQPSPVARSLPPAPPAQSCSHHAPLPALTHPGSEGSRGAGRSDGSVLPAPCPWRVVRCDRLCSESASTPWHQGMHRAPEPAVTPASALGFTPRPEHSPTVPWAQKTLP